jgi:DNA replication protein DnaD
MRKVSKRKNTGEKHMYKKKKFLGKAVSIRLLPYQWEMLDTLSDERQMSVSALVREALEKAYEQKKASA